MKKSFAALAAAAMLATTGPALADLTVPNLSYRTGSYAANGIPYADGFADYFTLLNERDGGIGGEKVAVPECETAYNTEKGVECYESTKGQAALAYNPLSTGITYQLIPKVTADKHVLYTPGYGRTSAANGAVFEWVFNYPANYWDGASVAVKYMMAEQGGDLTGKKITLLYHNSAYGKEPIRTLAELAKKHGFTLTLLPVDPPGQEQKSQWLQIRREKPDYVIMYGWGVMNQVAIQEAVNIKFPMDHMMGIWWSGSENDVGPAGAGANGYKSISFHGVGAEYPIYADLKKHVFDAGKAAGAGDQLGTVLYSRGMYAAMIISEAIRTAQEKTGKAAVTPEEVRDGFESLNLTEARLTDLGLPGFAQPIAASCADHGGPGTAMILQWDASAKKWSAVSEWIAADAEVLDPLIAEDSAAFAKESGIAERCK
ncbi:ABC transporter substrate-binding protein [Rhodobacter capsulatus]|uniref:ABC transporter substrate-binding protein n=1 Tax=Rhodobacter capsulatus TaxID=1061 RepID=UPI0006DCA8DA|nr:ABC transporter substrate-binding protein [Rhodobacter capsulatus]KQB14494.1 ABC transporter permease [Rhodobacter capsulatus]KQB14793.1 ABC transporter permease [Rhodobacter capsulatus]PZX25127.1 branched-chain amino acid transport system substrate-binding protein [Rhodobacter capsulatus]QNR63166.1 ABC transporter substrate-binding protein [Rhodobacter capsulatus]